MKEAQHEKTRNRALTVILSFVLTVNMCPTAAFVAATGTQGPEIAEEFGQSATVDESDIDLALYEQPEMPSEHTASEPGGTNADAAESAHGNADDGARGAQTSESSSADGTTSSDNTSESKNATQVPEASPASAATYAHTATAEQNGVTFTVEWNDAPAGTATTFHVSQTGGSANAKVRMDVPVYFDGGSQEIVCDPSRGDWKPYHSLGADGHDYTFEFTASGTYRIYFYFLNGDSGIWYLRTASQIAVSDTTRPSVSRIVNDTVARCRRETDGSEYAMSLWLHDWTLDQLEYDRSLNWCSAESGLTRQLGTCESYQRIYAKLLDAAGIANGRIVGNGHTWNAVRIDGKWCQMDLTWDDSGGNWYGDLDQRHLYFGLTDELMAIAHSDHTANYQADDYAYRSTDLSNAYFVRSGKADEWAEAYADRIQQHLDAKETEFSIDADNASFPPSISGIQNALIAHAMNQREWTTGGNKVDLTAASTVTEESNSKWSAKYEFVADYTVAAGPITEQPADASVPMGSEATFTCRAEGTAAYRWQCSEDGGTTWYNTGLGGCTTDTLSFRAGEAYLFQRLYRCVVRYHDGTRAVSRGASLSFAAGPVHRPRSTNVAGYPGSAPNDIPEGLGQSEGCNRDEGRMCGAIQ